MADDDDFQNTALGVRTQRRTYLITYSQANLRIFPTRQNFGETIAALFNAGEGKVKVMHWASCLEKHRDGGDHFHMCIKLNGPKKWKDIKNSVSNKYGVELHFSDHHRDYITAYRYVTKSDENVFHSPEHPNLKEAGSPRTKKCVAALRAKRKSNIPVDETAQQIPSKAKKLSNLEVIDFINENGIRFIQEFYAIAHEQRNEGKIDLAHFIASKSPKAMSDLLQVAHGYSNAPKAVARTKKSRMDLINDAFEGPCHCKQENEWLSCATQVLVNNGLHPFVFADKVRKLLTYGRGKERNIIIVGPPNCGKSFLLKPLELIFETFTNPANDKYAWVGVDRAEAIFLNDFRWSSELIPWHTMLLLLEGHSVNLPAPKNHFSKDVFLTADTPVFATSKETIKYVGRFNATDEVENKMMDARWAVIKFNKPIQEIKDIRSCSKCFAKLIKLGE